MPATFPPFSDPRNAAGLTADVLQYALDQPREFVPVDRGPIPAGVQFIAARTANCLLVIRKFATSAKNVLHGSKRKGVSGLYQDAVRFRDHLAKDLESLAGWKTRSRVSEILHGAPGIAGTGLGVVITAMERGVAHLPSMSNQEDRPYGFGGVMPAYELNNLIRDWHYRDMTTDTPHRKNKNIKAAFESAWEAGEFEMALQIAKKGYG